MLLVFLFCLVAYLSVMPVAYAIFGGLLLHYFIALRIPLKISEMKPIEGAYHYSLTDLLRSVSPHSSGCGRGMQLACRQGPASSMFYSVGHRV